MAVQYVFILHYICYVSCTNQKSWVHFILVLYMYLCMVMCIMIELVCWWTSKPYTTPLYISALNGLTAYLQSQDHKLAHIPLLLACCLSSTECVGVSVVGSDSTICDEANAICAAGAFTSCVSEGCSLNASLWKGKLRWCFDWMVLSSSEQKWSQLLPLKKTRASSRNIMSAEFHSFKLLFIEHSSLMRL